MSTAETTEPIALYAELLSNLRQLSVVASLPSSSDATTSACITDDGSALTVSHQGQSQTLRLPEKPIASALHIPAQASAEVAWRLRLPPLAKPIQRFTLEDQPLPWSAQDIKKGSPITCRVCGDSLVKRDCIGVWKDLPSDNWAEMMEFWHCHKPVDHIRPAEGPDSNDTSTKKGYGANNIISAQHGVGLIDVTSFVLSQIDCSGVMCSSLDANNEVLLDDAKVGQTGPTQFLHAYCKGCASDVGVLNLATRAISLFKWSIVCETAMPSPAPDITQCLAATLMATISKSGSAKSIVAPHLIGGRGAQQSRVRSLYVWVLNSNVEYASSVNGRNCIRSAMKLLFKTLPVVEGNDIVDAMDSDVQELNLSPAAIETVATALEASNRLLPLRERMFQDWRVGLLNRWKPKEQD